MKRNNKPLTEEKVLKKLQIENFRQLTKDKVISMATMLDKMDPEVAKKALEQFPNFCETMKDIMAEFKQTLDKALETNNESVKSYYNTCDMLIQSCNKMLEEDDLSFEQRESILGKMIEITKMKGEKDTENKKFIVRIVGISVTITGISMAALLAALGGNSNISSDN